MIAKCLAALLSGAQCGAAVPATLRAAALGAGVCLAAADEDRLQLRRGAQSVAAFQSDAAWPLAWRMRQGGASVNPSASALTGRRAGASW